MEWLPAAEEEVRTSRAETRRLNRAAQAGSSRGGSSRQSKWRQSR